MPDIDHSFPVRIQRTSAGEARAYARAEAFAIGSQASLRESDNAPSAVEYAIGALGGDLICGFERAAEAEGVPIQAIEISLNGRLDNILTHLGVVGEQGHPGFAAIEGTAYVGSDADEPAIRRAWQRTLDRSPLYHTFTRCAAVTILLKVVR
jgi:OsmC-like protein